MTDKFYKDFSIAEGLLTGGMASESLALAEDAYLLGMGDDEESTREEKFDRAHAAERCETQDEWDGAYKNDDGDWCRYRGGCRYG